MFLNIRPKFLVQTSSSLMLVENDSNHIVTKMFLTYTIITEKNLIKQKNMVRCRVKRQKSISKIMVKNNSEVQNFSYFFTSIRNHYFYSFYIS